MATTMATPPTPPPSQRSNSSSSSESDVDPALDFATPESESDNRRTIYKDDVEGPSASEVESDDDEECDDEFSPNHEGDDVDTWITSKKKKKRNAKDDQAMEKITAEITAKIKASSPNNKKQRQNVGVDKPNPVEEDDVVDLMSSPEKPPAATAAKTVKTKKSVKDTNKITTTAKRTSPRKHASTTAAAAAADTTETTGITSNLSSPSSTSLNKTKGKKRKVSMSPTDSLAKVRSTADKKREKKKSSSSKIARKKQKHDEDDDSDDDDLFDVVDEKKSESTSTQAGAATTSKKRKQEEKKNENKKKKQKVSTETKKAESVVEKKSKKPANAAPVPSNTTRNHEEAKAADAMAAETTKALSAKASSSTTDTAKQTTKPASTTKKAQSTKDPPKKKIKKKTFQDQLLSKLFLACKPFSLKELIQVMPAGTSEPSVNFCLLACIDKNWVLKKESTMGKSGRVKEIYWANQDCQSKELKSILSDVLLPVDEIANTRRELAGLQQQSKALQSELAQVIQTPSNVDLQNQVVGAQQEVEQLESQLEAMKHRISMMAKTNGGNNAARGGKMTPLALKKKHNKLVDEWRRRKRLCMDFIDNLSDAMEKSPKDVIKKVLELETDEDVLGTDFTGIPQKHDLPATGGSNRIQKRWSR
mmetsp:Transcript_34673/g.83743  ORF Transcript_34673/g.83743 Transcript_34673/m.83743 type:complete len:647 (+) Transcript_34673:327-2267(+)